MATADLSHLLHPIYLPSAATTLVGFRLWATSESFPQWGHISYIDGGLVIDMSPERPETHGKIKAEISQVIDRMVKERDLGVFYPDRTLLGNQQAGLSTEPDGMFASWETLEAGRFHWQAGDGGPGDYVEVLGAPDWVLEIVSASSLQKDTRLLLEAYHRAGVREYWLIDALGEQIDFRLLRHAPDGYQQVAPSEGWYWSEVFARAFQLQRQRDRMNLWRYTLRVR